MAAPARRPAFLAHHQDQYRHLGRWILSSAILVGCVGGLSTTIHEAVTASVTAFLAGGILLNTFKEELPEERESRFWAFALGAALVSRVAVAAVTSYSRLGCTSLMVVRRPSRQFTTSVADLTGTGQGARPIE